MKKLQELRQHLIDSIPGIRDNPERLLTFIEDGSIRFHRGANLSHEYRVPARIVLTDHSGDIDTVMIPLLQWLSRYSPDTLGDDAIQFQAELLSNHSWDLAIDVTLTERVVALVDCETGRINAEHRMPAYEIDPCAARQWQLYIKDANGADEYQLAAEWGDADSSPTE